MLGRICWPFRSTWDHPQFWWRRVAESLVFYVVSYVLLFFCLSFIFIHGVVSLFSINELDCPSGIFRPSLAKFFNFIFRYIDDVLSLNNPYFSQYLHLIYILLIPVGLLHYLICPSILTETDNFTTINFQFLSSNLLVRRNWCYVCAYSHFGRHKQERLFTKKKLSNRVMKRKD